jgi:hypothetical protein
MPDEQPFETILSRRLHAIWEKAEALTLSVYTVGDDWVETRPIAAPDILRKIAGGFLEVACELDALANDVAAEDKRFAEYTTALGKSYAEAMSTFERDTLSKRFGEIVRRKPSEPTP